MIDFNLMNIIALGVGYLTLGATAVALVIALLEEVRGLIYDIKRKN